MAAAGDASWAQQYAALRSSAVKDEQRVPLEHVLIKESDAAVFGVVLNLTKTVIGSGILCLPFQLQEGGAGLGILSIAATGALSLAGFLAIGKACDATGAQSYREAWHRTVGTWPLLVDVMILLECVITCVGYVILILDYLSTGLQGLAGMPATQAVRMRLAAIVAVICLIPLCLRPSMDGLKFSSLLGNLAMLYTMTYVILDCLAWDEHGSFLEDATFLSTHHEGVFRSTAVMTSAYIAHYSAPDFLKEISTKHPKPWKGFRRAAIISFGASIVAYWLFAVAGYERFGSSVLGNVLLNYDSTLWVFLAWVSMAATLVFGFPLVFKPARDTMAKVLALSPPTEGESQGQRAATPLSCPWGLMTALVVIATVVAGVYFRDISRVLSFRGALLGCPISFIFPGAMLLHCPSRDVGLASTIHAWMLILFGVVAGSLGLYCTLLF